jgi:hypothetical protein
VLGLRARARLEWVLGPEPCGVLCLREGVGRHGRLAHNASSRPTDQNRALLYAPRPVVTHSEMVVEQRLQGLVGGMKLGKMLLGTVGSLLAQKTWWFLWRFVLSTATHFLRQGRLGGWVIRVDKW